MCVLFPEYTEVLSQQQVVAILQIKVPALALGKNGKIFWSYENKLGPCYSNRSLSYALTFGSEANTN